MIEGPADSKVVEKHADKLRIPEHLRMIRFGLDKAVWQPQNKDALGDTLCEFEHRSSKHSTDLGHVTVDPFRIVHKQTRRLRSRSPTATRAVLAAQSRTENYKPSAGEQSSSNWVSPLVVVAQRQDATPEKQKPYRHLRSSRRERSHRELQAFCWWANLLEMGWPLGCRRTMIRRDA